MSLCPQAPALTRPISNGYPTTRCFRAISSSAGFLLLMRQHHDTKEAKTPRQIVGIHFRPSEPLHHPYSTRTTKISKTALCCNSSSRLVGNAMENLLGSDKTQQALCYTLLHFNTTEFHTKSLYHMRTYTHSVSFSLSFLSTFLSTCLLIFLSFLSVQLL